MSGLKIKFDSWNKVMQQTAVTAGAAAAAAAAASAPPAAAVAPAVTSAPNQPIISSSPSAATAAPVTGTPAAPATPVQTAGAQSAAGIAIQSASAAAAAAAIAAATPAAIARNTATVIRSAGDLPKSVLMEQKPVIATTSTVLVDKKPAFGSGVTSAFTSMPSAAVTAESGPVVRSVVSSHAPAPAGPQLAAGVPVATSPQTCCLSDEGLKRCNRTAGNASYSKRIQKIAYQKKMRLTIDSTARHVYICDYHKNLIQSTRAPGDPPLASSAGRTTTGATAGTKRKRKELVVGDEDFMMDSANENSVLADQDMFSGHGDGRNDSVSSHFGHHNPQSSSHAGHGSGRGGGRGQHANIGMHGHSGAQSLGGDIDLSCLQVNTLRRYKKHFHVQTKPGLNKQMLSESVQRHLKSIALNEKEAITYFIFMVKMGRNKLDKNIGAVSHHPGHNSSGDVTFSSPHLSSSALSPGGAGSASAGLSAYGH